MVREEECQKEEKCQPALIADYHSGVIESSIEFIFFEVLLKSSCRITVLGVASGLL